MFAIELTPDTFERIAQDLDTTRVDAVELDIYMKSDFMWVIIQGYQNSRGVIEPWAAFPKYILERSFEYDPIKIKTDWDQIVRK